MKSGSLMFDFVVDENLFLHVPDTTCRGLAKLLLVVNGINPQTHRRRTAARIEQRVLNTLFRRAALLPVPEEDGRDNAKCRREGRQHCGSETKLASGKIEEHVHVVVGVTMAQLRVSAMQRSIGITGASQ